MMDAIGLSLSAEEAIARTVHCTECNAPPNQPCQKVNWENQRTPHCVSRRYHCERLRDARRVARIREKLNGGDDPRQGLPNLRLGTGMASGLEPSMAGS